MRVSRYFKKHEVECHGDDCCGHSAPVAPRLLFLLDEFRHLVGEPVLLSCAFRCLVHNISIGSHDGSQHPLGTAADIQQVDGMTPDEMQDVAERVLGVMSIPGGIGVYHWGIHVDVRDVDADRNPVAPWRADSRAA